MALEMSEVHVIAPEPNTTLEGPMSPLKAAVGVPEMSNILRKSYPASVEKAVAVMRVPMASAVGVMVHDGTVAEPTG